MLALCVLGFLLLCVVLDEVTSSEAATLAAIGFAGLLGANLALGLSMSAAVEQRLRSERMKTELITNVSHDLKTPLTSVVNYAELVVREAPAEGKLREYADVLLRQSERLKRLIEDLVEASKASTGNLEVELMPCDAAVFLTQAAGEYEEKLAAADLTLVTKTPEKELRILADGRRMWRIFDNLMGNALKYALPGTRVYLSLEEQDGEAVFSFKGQEGGGEGLQRPEVIGLDGVHVLVGHFGGAVHGDPLEAEAAPALALEVGGLRHPVRPLVPTADLGGVEGGAALGLPVVEPEGGVDALDLLQVVLAGEELGQQGLFPVVLLQGRDGLLLGQLEGDDPIGPQSAAQLPRHDAGIAAVGAAGGRRGLVADQLRPAGGAVIDLQPRRLRLAPMGALRLRFPGGSLGGLGRLCVSLGVKGLNLRRVVGAAAVFAGELPRDGVEAQGPGTGRALIVGDAVGQ